MPSVLTPLRLRVSEDDVGRDHTRAQPGLSPSHSLASGRLTREL